jgi:hypothetical protein
MRAVIALRKHVRLLFELRISIEVVRYCRTCLLDLYAATGAGLADELSAKYSRIACVSSAVIHPNSHVRDNGGSHAGSVITHGVVARHAVVFVGTIRIDG